MGEAGNSDEKLQTSCILAIGLAGLSKRDADQRARAIAQLEQIVENTTRFRVAEVAGKVVRQETQDGLLLIFQSDSETALECAVEIARESKEHPEIQIRSGLHAGMVNRDAETRGNGEAIDLARAVMNLGDGGHILLSKRLAYELATQQRWNEHFYELGEYQIAGEKTSLVNFFTTEIGNSRLPEQLERMRAEAGRRAKVKSLKRPIRAVFLIVVCVAVFAAGYTFVNRSLNLPGVATVPATEKSIAILPFADLSPARDQEYLSDGISEEILNAVAKLKNVRVIARDSAFAFKNKNLDPPEIGRRLNVDTIVQGAVRREENRVHAAVELIDVLPDSKRWSRSFDRDLRELPEFEDEIARAVAESLKVSGTIATPKTTGDDPLTNDLYLQGLFLSHKAGEEDLKASLDFFRLALEKNPKLSRARSGIAKDWIQLSQSALVQPLDGYSSAQKAASAALAIDPRDPQAHVYLGEAKRMLSWDLKGDEAELKRALELDPNCVAALLAMASLKNWTGSPDESRANIQSALRIDPFSPLVGHAEVIVDLDSDRFDLALAAARRMIETDPNYTYFEPDLALVYREQGKLYEALDIYLRLEKTKPQPGLAITYARLNRQEEAKRILAELIQRSNQYFPADEIAAVYLALGDREEAFRWLDRAASEHSATLHNLGCGRDFRSLRSDPRYSQLLYRIGLDPKRFVPQ